MKMDQELEKLSESKLQDIFYIISINIMKEFVTLEDVKNIYCISWRIIRDILRNNRVHFYEDREILYINFKEFHNVYTSKYNPALFTEEDCNSVVKKQEILKEVAENKENRTFFNIFTAPVDSKVSVKKLILSYASQSCIIYQQN